MPQPLRRRLLPINYISVFFVCVWNTSPCRGGFVTDFSGARAPQYTPIFNQSMGAWTFADEYESSTSPTVLFAQVCAAEALCAAEPPPPGGCVELQALVDEAGWTNTANTHTVCAIQYADPVATDIRVQDAVRLVVAHKEGLLQEFDSGDSADATTLRLRLLYVTVVDAATVRVRTRRMTVELPMLQDPHAVVMLVARCTVLELTSPRPSLSALSGGSYMQMREAGGEEQCVWQCGHRYYKLPFNAPAYTVGSAATGQCVAMPAEFVAIRASFKLTGAVPSGAASVQSQLLFLQQMDEAAQKALARLQTEDQGAVAVIFSLRGSPFNTLSLQMLLDKYSLEPGMSYQVVYNDAFVSTGRRLLDQHSDITVDMIAITSSADMPAANFSITLLSVVAAQNFSGDLPVGVDAVDTAIESAHLFKRPAAVRPPAPTGQSPSTPGPAWLPSVATADPATITFAIGAWFVAVASCAGCVFFSVNMFCPQIHFARYFFSYKRRPANT